VPPYGTVHLSIMEGVMAITIRDLDATAEKFYKTCEKYLKDDTGVITISRDSMLKTGSIGQSVHLIHRLCNAFVTVSSAHIIPAAPSKEQAQTLTETLYDIAAKNRKIGNYLELFMTNPSDVLPTDPKKALHRSESCRSSKYSL
jgi:hypothetical protein